MKKFISLSLILALLVFSGCSKVTDNQAANTNKESSSTQELKDGDYLIKMPANDHGIYSLATTKVENGKIIDFDYNEYFSQTGEAKNENNYEYKEGLEVIKNLNQQFTDKKNLDNIDYDAVSGATSTKSSFKDTVGKLLEKAEKGETYSPVYKDGVYEAKASEPNHGWLSQIKIVVKNGTVTGVDFHDVAVEDMDGTKAVLDKDGKPVVGDDNKQKTETVKIKKGDIKSTENYEHLPAFDTITEFQKQIIYNDGVENLKLDAISGATSTRDTMIELAKEALKQAK